MMPVLLRRGSLALLLAVTGDLVHPGPVAAAGADRAVVLRPGSGQYPLGERLQLRAENGDPLTIDQVSAPGFQHEFRASQTPNPRLGTGQSAWVKFAVTDSTAGRDNWLLEVALTYYESIELYVPAGDAGTWEIKRSGSLYPFSGRERPHRHFVFDLPVKPAGVTEFYVRFAYVDRGVLAFPLTIWSRDAFAAYDHESQITLGLFYGVMMVMAAYHALLFFSLRDLSYLYYVLMLLAATLLFAFQNGLAAEYLWPHRAFGWNLPDLCFLGLLYVTGGKFVQSFLMTRRNASTLHVALWCMIGVWAILIAVGLVGFPGAFRPLARFSVASLALILVAGAVCWARGYGPARYFTLGWAVPVGVGILMNLADIEVFAAAISSMQMTQAGMAFGVVMFSLGLTSRIRLLRREKEAHQTAALEAAVREREVALEKQVLEQELHTAHEMQMGLMPDGPLTVGGFEVSGHCEPATQVGGDLFQYFEGDGRVGACLADVTGHAMEAAIPVVRLSGLLDAEFQRYRALDELFTSLNHALCRSLNRRSFVCFSMVEVEVESNLLHASNAGCPHACHYSSSGDAVSAIELDAYPLGVNPNTAYPTFSTHVESGDKIVLCSDGIIEAESVVGEQLGFDRWPELVIRACRDNASAGDVVAQIVADVQRFCGGLPQKDDMTCVALCIA